MAFILTADQMVRVSARVVDAHGNPVSLDATPTFNSSDVAILSLEPVAGDAFSVYCVSVGPIGTASLRATMGGIDSESLEFEIVPGSAFRIDLVAGQPEPK